jgi:ketosteroid isomerase-like protein
MDHARFLPPAIYMGIICLFMLAGCKVMPETPIEDDQQAIEETRERVFTAYKAGDLDTMMVHFHPDVIQIPSYDKALIGKERVRANYAAALEMFDIVISDDLENMYIDGDVATTHGLYTVTLTPKAGGEPMQRSGRYMVIMKRWAGSPTGWSTFRELVQPAA